MYECCPACRSTNFFCTGESRNERMTKRYYYCWDCQHGWEWEGPGYGKLPKEAP